MITHQLPTYHTENQKNNYKKNEETTLNDFSRLVFDQIDTSNDGSLSQEEVNNYISNFV